jgi:hypothetical protein
MQFIWRRYARSGYAPTWFYAFAAAGFCALIAWAAAARDWLVLVLAVVMLPVCVIGGLAMQRLRTALTASTDAVRDMREERRDG